jgi:hypothetical protein
MSYKRATLRFYVALTGLLASLLELSGAFVRLLAACLERLTKRLQAPVSTPASAPAPAPVVVMATANERLIAALSSMKFPAARVRAFAASVSGRTEPLEALVKEGIVALSN